MEEESVFYKEISSMEPLLPLEDVALENLASELLEKTARLSGVMNPITRNAIADFLAPMNSYYSNLIEGHDTHPIDIYKALKNEYQHDKKKRDLQIEAKAHIDVFSEIMEMFDKGEKPIPTSVDFLKDIHSRFYKHLPQELRMAKSKDGEDRFVEPGKFRDCEVEVGRHIAPYSKNLEEFMGRFESYYNPKADDNAKKNKRIISIAASHHRLVWIHPFLDGNGRVVRLFSDAFFAYENIHSSGLWSISRGLARSKGMYMEMLANADLKRRNDFDGRGNLSDCYLKEFCVYFLKTAIDQVDFMYKALDTENMLIRINAFVDLMIAKGNLKNEARYILTDVFLKGKISKQDAERITGTSDKTLKRTTDYMQEVGLLKAVKESKIITFYASYPITFSPVLFPGFYPQDKEIDMMANL